MAAPAIQPRVQFISVFKQIGDIELKTPLQKNQTGYFIVDLDQTLAEPVIRLITDQFAYFLQELCEQIRVKPESLTSWWSTRVKPRYIREAPHQPTDSTVLKTIQQFREAGWLIRVVTNRPQKYAHFALKHLKDAGFDIKEEECDFKGEGSLETKGDRIQKILASSAPAESTIRTVFVDDDPQNLTDVMMAKIEGSFYQYISSKITNKQRDELIVQLYCHKRKDPIPSAIHSKALLEEAKRDLWINQTNKYAFAKTFIAACLDLAKQDPATPPKNLPAK